MRRVGALFEAGVKLHPVTAALFSILELAGCGA